MDHKMEVVIRLLEEEADKLEVWSRQTALFPASRAMLRRATFLRDKIDDFRAGIFKT